MRSRAFDSALFWGLFFGSLCIVVVVMPAAAATPGNFAARTTANDIALCQSGGEQPNNVAAAYALTGAAGGAAGGALIGAIAGNAGLGAVIGAGAGAAGGYIYDRQKKAEQCRYQKGFAAGQSANLN